MSSPGFVPDAGHVLRAAFSEFRTDASARGIRDVDILLKEESACRAVLEKLGVAPALVSARVPHAPSTTRSYAAGPDGQARPKSLPERGAFKGALRVVTWNVAGGLKSDDAPSSHSLMDQHANIMKEVLRLSPLRSSTTGRTASPETTRIRWLLWT